MTNVADRLRERWSEGQQLLAEGRVNKHGGPVGKQTILDPTAKRYAESGGHDVEGLNPPASAWDVRLARWIGAFSLRQRIAYHYPRWRQFVRVHIAGFVSQATKMGRLHECEQCPHATTDPEGAPYRCRALRCNCPNWRFTKLRHLTRLRWFGCPVGKFPASIDEPQTRATYYMRGAAVLAALGFVAAIFLAFLLIM